MGKEKIQKLSQTFEKIHTNKLFETIVVIIILLSSVLVGVKTFPNSDSLFYLVILDMFVTVFFLTEAIIKILGQKKWTNYFKSGWNVFDFSIVVISLIPLGSSQYALLGRLLRIFRVLRLITVIPELKRLIESLIKAIPSILSISALLFIIFYIYAAIGSLVFAEINPQLWGNLFLGLLTMFRIMTFEDWTDIMYETIAVYPMSWMFYVSFIFLTVFTFLNLFIGTIISSIDDQREKQKQAKKAVFENKVLEKLENLEKEISTLKSENSKLKKQSNSNLKSKK